MLRFGLFITLIFMALTLPPWLFILAAILYTLLYTPYELIILAACLDAYFAPTGTLIPYYTLGFGLLALVGEWLRIRLHWQEN